ncbi:MAG: glycosyltransferase [Oscillospiraceae bacterium]
MIKISIVIPVYNTAEYLEKCLESVVNQTYKNLDIIIINDGSTDNSADIIEKYDKQDDRITVVNTENNGVSKARNIGIDLSNGEYIWFIDSDDFLYPESVEKLYNSIGSCDMAASNVNIITDNEVPKKFLNLPKDDKITVDFNFINDLLGDRVHIGGSLINKMYRTEIIKKMNIRFEERSLIYAEDAMFNFKSFKYIRNIAIVDEPLYGYYQRSTSVSHTYKPNLAKRCENFVEEINYYYNNKYKKALKMRCFVFFIEILYNEKKAGYKAFENVLKNKYFETQLQDLDISGISKKRKMIYILRKFPLILYCVYKASRRES